MPSEIGQICRTKAQEAMRLSSPCIQITPVYPNSLEEWAKLFFYFLEMSKSIEKKVDTPFIVDIKETGAKKVQCPCSDNGYHEFMKIQNEVIVDPYLICLHCGALTSLTTKTPEELKEFFKNKKFKEKEILREKIEEAKEF